MQMPDPDPSVLSRRAHIVSRLEAALGADAVISAEEEVKAYECDALTAYKCPPLAAILPTLRTPMGSRRKAPSI